MSRSWKIFTHEGRISQSEESEVWCSLKAFFRGEDWEFVEDEYRIICWERNQFEIKVTFRGHEYEVGDDDTKAFGVILTSEPFGYKTGEEKAHRKTL